MPVPPHLKYTEDHEWLRQDEQSEVVIVGITDHAQSQLGDVVFVELPDVGAQLQKGESFGTVESVKAVSDLFAPISGEVTEVNATLREAPDIVNTDPYGNAWMIKIKPARADEMAALLSAAAYDKVLAS